MKTKEELNVLKAEVEPLDHKLVELNEDELKQVAGGDSRTIGEYVFTGNVGKHDGVIGNRYFITVDGSDCWYMGVLTAINDKYIAVFLPELVYAFRVMLKNGYSVDESRMFDGNTVTLYTSCNKYN